MDRSAAACRQLVSRAKAHVTAARPRFEAKASDRERLLDRFVAAMETGDLDALVTLLQADATMTSDHGGKALAAMNTIFGADKVARYLLGIQAKAPEGYRVERRQINGESGFVGYLDDAPNFALMFSAGSDGRIHEIYLTNNPDKLAYLTA